MPAASPRPFTRGLLISGLLATLPFTACAPEPVDPTGTGGATTGTGGQTGSGGAATSTGGAPGSGGAPNPGSGGAANPGTGGASNPGSGGATNPGSGGRQGGNGGGGRAGSSGTGGNSGSAGRAGTGGSSGTAGRAGTGGGPGAGGSSGTLPAGYALCVPCHGETGAGVPGMGVDIQHPVNDFSTWVIRNGRMHPDFPQPMTAYTTTVLPDAQLQGILTYLAARPKPTTGQALYVDYCANCHGANAAGGVTMRPINTENMSAFTTNVRGGHHPGEFAMRRDFMPKWTAAELSDAEIRLIFMYVDSL